MSCDFWLNVKTFSFVAHGTYQESDVIVVYNHAFCPREYLREKLALQIINFMRNCVAPDDKAGTIQRPTGLYHTIRFELSPRHRS